MDAVLVILLNIFSKHILHSLFLTFKFVEDGSSQLQELLEARKQLSENGRGRYIQLLL